MASDRVAIEGTIKKQKINLIATPIPRAPVKGGKVVGVLAIAGLAVGGIILLTRSAGAAGIPPGDVNGDGIVDVLDLIAATRISNGDLNFPTDWILRADVNGDGVVDYNDLSVIEDTILGLV